MAPWERFFFGVFSQWKLDSFWRGFWVKRIFKNWSWFEGFWRLNMVYCAQVKFSNVPTKQEKKSLSIHFLSCEWAIFGMGCFLPPRTSTATNKHPTRSFRSVGSGCRGAEALPKDLDEVRFFCQQTDKKGGIFSHGWRADWLIFHVNSLSQMA